MTLIFKGKYLGGKIYQKVRNLYQVSKWGTAPYFFGFIPGHAHLTTSQVDHIRNILMSTQNEGIVNEYEHKMASLIGSGFGISFAAGRMAFYAMLRVLNIGPGDEVILPGFTCAVMPNAVWRTGATPVYSDIDPDTLGSDAKKIEDKITHKTKLIVAQHTFGIPCGIQEILKVGEKYKIFVLEDCALSLDSKFDGLNVGNFGHAAIFSTDHTKPVNTLIGGLFYTRDKPLFEEVKQFSENLPVLDKDHQKRIFDQFLYERWYCNPKRYPRMVVDEYLRNVKQKFRPQKPEFTFLIYDNGKNVNSQSYPYPAKMPEFLAQLGLFELERWEEQKNMRKNLLLQYLEIMKKMDFVAFIPKAYFDPSREIAPLRFAFADPNIELKIGKIWRYVDVNATWFREPVMYCPNGPEGIGYIPGSCSTAELIGKKILNWPCIVENKWQSTLLEIFKTYFKK